ncbi:MAG TPA: hypothetical protein VMY05_02220 [Acidobacteriota bacterium]|nr:hypothetical protein [Acidobacteriota bacterium]
MKPRTLLLLPLITFFSVNSNAVMAALDHTAVTLIQDQSNYPELTESVAPTPGNPWTWSVSGFSGFAGSPSIWFDYQNADQTRAELHWSGFATSDWEGGADGSFTLTLSNGVDADRVYPMSLSLRSLVGDGYTVFEQQTSGGVMVLQPGAEGFVFSASNFSGLSPAPSISFDAMGAVLSCTTPNWTGDGTFTLTVKDGTRPDAVIDGVGLSLRYIDATNFTVFRGQTGGGDAIPATDAGTYGFGVAPGSFSGISSDLDLGFTSRGATYVNDPGTVTWDEDGTFTMRINDGTRPYSDLANLSLHLRRLVGTDFTVFQGQTGGGDAIPATDAGTYVFGVAPGSFSGISSDLDLGFTSRGAIYVNDPGTVTWDEDGTFTMRINDGTRPYSDVANLSLHLRRLVGSDFTVFEGQTGGGDALPAADVGTYVWGVAPGSFSGISSDLDLGFTSRGAIYVNDPGTVTWDEDGTFTLRINDGTRPYSDVANLSLHLRRLVGSDFTVFEGQTGGGEAIPATDAGTYVFGVAPGSFSGISSDLDLGFTSRGAIYVNDPGTVTWDEDGTFTMRVNPDLGPFSDISGLALSLRRIIPSPLIVLDNGDSGSVEIQVDGDPGPWDWSDYADGLAMSALSAPDTSNSASVRISWGAGDLVGGETGSGSLTIRRSDQSAPASTTSLATQVTAAGCCIGMTGNIDGDPEEIIDIGDLTALISYLFIPPNEAPGCTEEANVDGDEEGIVDIGDLTALIDYLFISHTPPADCP